MSEPVETVETMVRVYKDTGDYDKDQRKLAKDGWLTLTMVERTPRAGIGRMATLGLMAVVRPPKPELVVTYQRTKPSKGKKPQAAPPMPTMQGGPNFCPNCGHAVKPDAKFCPNCRQQLR
jgi:hypothetical protein